MAFPGNGPNRVVTERRHELAALIQNLKIKMQRADESQKAMFLEQINIVQVELDSINESYNGGKDPQTYVPPQKAASTFFPRKQPQEKLETEHKEMRRAHYIPNGGHPAEEQRERQSLIEKNSSVATVIPPFYGSTNAAGQKQHDQEITGKCQCCAIL